MLVLGQAGLLFSTKWGLSPSQTLWNFTQEDVRFGWFPSPRHTFVFECHPNFQLWEDACTLNLKGLSCSCLLCLTCKTKENYYTKAWAWALVFVQHFHCTKLSDKLSQQGNLNWHPPRKRIWKTFKEQNFSLGLFCLPWDPTTESLPWVGEKQFIDSTQHKEETLPALPNFGRMTLAPL